MDFAPMNYRETPLGRQVQALMEALIEQQDQWDELPQTALGLPLVNEMAALLRALEAGYRSGGYPALAAAYEAAGGHAGQVWAVLQDVIRHGLLAEPVAYHLDQELCAVGALLRFLAVETGHGRAGGPPPDAGEWHVGIHRGAELVETGGFG